MSDYNPDRWVIVEIDNPADDRKTTVKVHKVYGYWYGGYAYGDSWRMNSGITKVVKDGEYFHFHGYTGSVYTCHKNSYGMGGAMAMIYDSFVKQAEDAGVKFRYLPEEEAMEYCNA
jgi:hypothetical protein